MDRDVPILRNEVLKKHYLTGNTHLDFEDYDLFKAMVEAHLFDKNSDTVVSFLPSPSLADILMKRPDSFGFFLCVNHPCEHEWGIA